MERKMKPSFFASEALLHFVCKIKQFLDASINWSEGCLYFKSTTNNIDEQDLQSFHIDLFKLHKLVIKTVYVCCIQGLLLIAIANDIIFSKLYNN